VPVRNRLLLAASAAMGIKEEYPGSTTPLAPARHVDSSRR